tara:strand:+ start:676 stop:822 length:147 start_codon:yes stop_codon:yes gene_type:complete
MPTPNINPKIETFEIIEMNDKLYLENNSLYAIKKFIGSLYQINEEYDY